MITLIKAVIFATDKSIPPQIIIIVWPHAIKPINATCLPMFIKLLNEKNTGFKSPNTIEIIKTAIGRPIFS